MVRDGKDGSYDVPPDHEPRAMIGRDGGRARPAAVGPAGACRRRSHAAPAGRTVGEIDDDWSLLDVDFADTEAFADEISSFGPDVLVEQPLQLREAVVRRLEGALAAHQEVAA